MLRLLGALPHGSQLTTQRAGPGSILAEASLFSARYHCDAVADEQSIVQVVPIRKARAAFAEQPVLAAAWAHHLAQEVHRARTRAEIISLRTVSDRMDAWVALNGDVLRRKGQWRRIASEIGISSEALYREICPKAIGGNAWRAASSASSTVWALKNGLAPTTTAPTCCWTSLAKAVLGASKCCIATR
jgi:CRP/FNR family transcriptional regulator, dissimilatory nitrate respiration regulator